MNSTKSLVTAEELQCLLADAAPETQASLPARLAKAGTAWLMTRIRRITLRG